LKRGDGPRDQPVFMGTQNIGEARWAGIRMLVVVFEVIQPDIEIDRRHAAALVMLRTGMSVRAASGAAVAAFRQILAKAAIE